jgi:hypothetical protein
LSKDATSKGTSNTGVLHFVQDDGLIQQQRRRNIQLRENMQLRKTSNCEKQATTTAGVLRFAQNDKLETGKVNAQMTSYANEQ